MIRNTLYAALALVVLSFLASPWAGIAVMSASLVVLVALIGVPETLQRIAAILLAVADGWNHAKAKRGQWAQRIEAMER